MKFTTSADNELQHLLKENTRLKALLTEHGIRWKEESDPAAEPNLLTLESPSALLSTTLKVALFRRLFRGRTDVYPLRWKSAKGKSGYSPACGNEWKPGVCHKPRIKCSDCDQRLLLPVTDQVIYGHLTGQHTVGVYPLLSDDTCYFLAADFDEAKWREDAVAFMQSCREMDIPAALEISRSGKGAHIWIFFADPVPAREARQLGAALISHTCERTRQLSLSSYDRLFPNQDILPKGGFGNLIALPLQKQPREQGYSVFVDVNFTPYPDQWAFLESVQPMSRPELESAVLMATGGRYPLDVAFVAEEDERKPWQQPLPVSSRISGPSPESLTLVLANQIFIAKADLPQP
ncbi:MAG: DNA primase small subunit domain-containing protein, partial [Nitrospiria bacterium]